MPKTIYEMMNQGSIINLTRSFAFSTGMGVVITDINGCHITPETNFCDFCQLMNRESSQQCYRSNSYALKVAIQTGKPFVFVCHAGLVDMITPISVGHRVIGSLMAGQIRVDSPMNLPRAGMHGMIRMNQVPHADSISEVTHLRLDACAQMLPLVADLIAKQLSDANKPPLLFHSKVNRPAEASLAPFTDASGHTWLRHNYALRRWLDMGESDRAEAWIARSLDLTRYLCMPQSAHAKLSMQCQMVESFFRLQVDVKDSPLQLDVKLDREVLDWSLPAYFLIDLVADGLAAAGPEMPHGELQLRNGRKGACTVLSIKDLGQGILPAYYEPRTWSLFTVDHVLAEDFPPAFKKALFDLLSGSGPFHVEITASLGSTRVDVLCDE